MNLNYQVRDRCTIVLTGDLPDPELKDEVGAMVQNIHGVALGGEQPRQGAQAQRD